MGPQASAVDIQGQGGAELAPARRAALAAIWVYAVALMAFWFISGAADADGATGHLLRLPLLAAPGIAALLGSRAATGRARLGWSMVAWAWFVSAVAGAVWLVSALAGTVPELDVAASWLYDAYYPFMFAGFLLLATMPRTAAGRFRLGLEALIVVGATQALAWYLMVRGWPEGVAFAWREVLSTFVGETLVLFSAALVLQGTQPGGVASALRVLALAAFAATVADLTSVSARHHASQVQLVLSESALALSAALVATAGLLAGLRRPDHPRAADLLVHATSLPHVAILAVSFVLLLELPKLGASGTAVPVLAATLVALTALAVLRLAAALRDGELEAAERSAREERLAQGQKLEALGQLAASVSHDFANLLIGMRSAAGALRERVGDAEEARELEQLAGRGVELCRSLLGFARRGPPSRAADLREVAENVAPLLRRLLPANVVLELSGPEGVCVLADTDQLEVAIVNLVVNARDAMPQGGRIEVSAEADAEPARGTRWVRLAVRDHGTGMDAATLARCREPFFTTKPAGRGTGLGLSTVNGIVESRGGRMEIDSAPGLGTRVSLWFPHADAAAAAHAPARLTPAPTGAALRPPATRLP